MMRLFRIIACAVILSALCCSPSTVGPRVTWKFDAGWRFSPGDTPEFLPGGNPGHYTAAAIPLWARYGFDDSSWCEYSAPDGCGNTDGTVWYRKHFTTPEGVGHDGNCLMFEFGGLPVSSSVYVNGVPAPAAPCRGTTCRYDVTELLDGPGQDNVVSVRCQGGRFGSVCMIAADPVHVAANGLSVATPQIDGSAASVHAEVSVTRFDNATGRVVFLILDAGGKKVASAEGVSIADMTIPRPRRFDPEKDCRYIMRAMVYSDGRLCDICDREFSVRWICN